MVRFGNNLKRIMKMRGVTSRELASRLGISEASVSRYLTGQREPSLDKLAMLSDVLDVSVDCLIFGDEGKKRQRDPEEHGKQHVLVFTGEFEIRDV